MNTEALLLDARDPASLVLAMGGGKAFNLARMSSLDVNVPQWIVVTTEVFDQFVSLLKLDFDITSDSDISTLSKDIEDRFLSRSLPEYLAEPIKEALSQQGLLDSFVAVRSSGLDEDSKAHSFAGQFSSFLYQKGFLQIEESIRRCWASGFSARALSYRLENRLDCHSIKVGVVIQKMVNADVAGVIFSRNPINLHDRQNLLNSATYGLGEGLVSGTLDADEYLLSRSDNKIKAVIAQKAKAYRRHQSGGLLLDDVDPRVQSESCLSTSDNQRIKQLALNLERSLKAPQDIEWALENGQLYCLQTRPITVCPTLAFYDETINGKKSTLWDNANIIESYSGVSSPLTFSFASRAYRQVYLQFLELMGVDADAIKDNDAVFRNMLGHVRGRIYYNLANWYRVLSYLPLNNNSDEFMETMMGLKGTLPDDIKLDLKDAPENRLSRNRRKAWVFMTTLGRFFRKKQIVKQFKDNFNAIYNRERKRNYYGLSLPEQLAIYNDLEKRVLNRWHAPIVNDFLCMIFFGVLKTLTAKWIKTHGRETLQNDLLCGQGHLESTEPTKMLMQIAQEIDRGPSTIRDEVLKRSPQELATELKRSTVLKPIAEKFSHFLEQYGFRSADELKLEEHDLHEDPSFALAAIQNYVRSKNHDINSIKEREVAIKSQAEAIVRQNLSGPKLWLYQWILKEARKAVATRESLRFDRTKIFGIIRHLFRAMGQNLLELELIDDKQDVFYLDINELMGFIEGRLSGMPLRDLIRIRKQHFAQYRQEEAPPDRFVTTGTAGVSFEHRKALMDGDIFSVAQKMPDDPSLLVGTSCCPGRVTASVLATNNINEAREINGQILATERTDPGWVPLYPSCAGLLIERGSLLSHSAVVARELGLPTIVGVRGLMKRIKSGDVVELDATSGTVRLSL